MGERGVWVRGVVLLLALGVWAAGCADGTTGMTHRETGVGMDSGTVDAGVVDAGRDANAVDVGGHDTNPEDTGVDAGPVVGTCEACTSDLNCDATSYCANLVTGGRACLPGCDTEFPSCPRGFTCIFDATGTGVHANICAPVGGPCCVDEDNDGYGVGVGCMGPDCNDVLATVHPDRDEICDGIDTNCNAHVDEDPNDCMSGRCSADGDGSYSAITGATCTLATCTSGTTTDCGLYTCHDGGAMGTTCATECAPTGTDDDQFCILTAHCDTGACIVDVPNGGTCDEDSDCGSTHCDNGFCCGSGTCCNTTSDCPGGGTVTRICDDPTHCQGHHGEVTCTANSCTAMSGIDDDAACDTSVTALSCGAYNPIVCTGTDPQPSTRTCPTSCVGDVDCVAAAHCDSAIHWCVPDLPPGGGCNRAQDCMDGLSCVDGVCCTSACTGTCEACNVPGSLGTCAPIMAGADPAGECPGVTCSGYYTGFTGGSDVCYARTAVGDAEATCDGARHCRTPDMLCPTQPAQSTPQIDCNDTCQLPHPGTCTGTTAGRCDNLDATAGTRSCGSGACTATVQACINGQPQMCMVGASAPEVCNGVDDNCNSVVDDGGAALCPVRPHVDAQVCNGTSGCGIAMNGCSVGYWNYDADLANGCECDLTGGGLSCAAPHPMGSIATGSTASATAALAPGQSSWFSVAFAPASGTGGRGGTPTITVGPADFRIAVFSNCTSSTFTCNAMGDPANSGTGTVTAFQFSDSIPNAPTGYTSASASWPSMVYVQVTRPVAPTTCGEGTFTLTVSR